MTNPAPPTLGYADLPRLISLMTGDEKHDRSAASTLDVLWVLYSNVLQVSPSTAQAADRDRFLLSKGHGPMAYYAVLAAKGFIPVDWLADWGSYGSPLGLHPDANLVPGVEIASGSLGHGLPLAVGVALGLRAQSIGARVVVLVGDAELDEGSNHEAIEAATAFSLDRLMTVVVDNASSTHGWRGGIASRFEAAGWAAVTVPGRDHAALEAALSASTTDGRPKVVVAVIGGNE